MDLSTPATILTFLQHQGYLIIFLLFVIEGPMLNYVAAFAASLGFFNVYIIVLLAITGNVVGDLIYFGIGRWGKKVIVNRHIHARIQSSKIDQIRTFLHQHPGKALSLIKLTPPLTLGGLMLAGASEMTLGTFLLYSLLISTLYSGLITALGFFSGHAFMSIGSVIKYEPLLVGLSAIVVVALWYALRWITHKMSWTISHEK